MPHRNDCVYDTLGEVIFVYVVHNGVRVTFNGQPVIVFL